ncbi:hypothetical protein [Priestia megaterium]|uniref:hypothetical protein n=1 Tax=Priestia megaterium TaxID=1404 RepID=UPI0039F6D6FC
MNTNNDEREFIKASNEVIDEFFKGNIRVFHDKSEFKKFWYKSKNEIDEHHFCMFPDCNQKAIKRSHTIQAEGPLNCVAENRHVLQPVFRDGFIILEKQGLEKKASVFPGYCKQHEKVFEFEKNKKLTSKKDYKLQIFRTICKEIYIVKRNLSLDRNRLNSYIKMQNKIFSEKILEKMHLKALNTEEFKVSKVETEEIQWIQRSLNSEEKHLELLESFYKNSINDLESKDSENLEYLVFRNEEIQLPVCLAGVAIAGGRRVGEKKYRNVPLILNVLPYDGGTDLVIATFKDNKDMVDAYTQQYFQNMNTHLEFLSIVETWMINGVDFWFLKPSIWENKDLKKQKNIIKKMNQLKYGIFTPYNGSIFDDLRKQIIIQVKMNLANGEYKGIEKIVKGYLKKEEKKLYR